MTKCPCGSNADFDACCGPILAGAPAPTAEALMRSRYVAYVVGNLAHVENTHAPEARDGYSREEAESMAKSVEWIGLEILSTANGGPNDDVGTVEFAARFKQDGALQVHHERSEFRREAGRWLYVDGTINPKGRPVRVEKVGRNDPCPCGSGKKYKKCCGA